MKPLLTFTTLTDPTDQLVDAWMTADPVGPDPDAEVVDAAETLPTGDSGHVLAMQVGGLGGVVSLRDLMGARINPA